MSASPASTVHPDTENGLPMTPLDMPPPFLDSFDPSFDVNALLRLYSESNFIQYDRERELIIAVYNGEIVAFPACFWPLPQPHTDRQLDMISGYTCTHLPPFNTSNPHLSLENVLPYLPQPGDTADPSFYFPLPSFFPVPLASIFTPEYNNGSALPTDPTFPATPVPVVEPLSARVSTFTDPRQKKIYDSLTQRGNIPDDVKHTVIDGLLSDGWAAHERLPVDVCSKLMYVYKAEPSTSGRGSRVELVHYVCLLCEWTSGVKGRADAWYHMNWHFDIKTKGCDLGHPQTKKPCTWRFHQNNDLWRHQEKVHGVARPKVKKGGHAASTPELFLSGKAPLWHPVVASIVTASASSPTSSVPPGSTSSLKYSMTTRSGPIIRAVPQPAAAAVGSSRTFAFRISQDRCRRRRRSSETDTEYEDDDSGSQGGRAPPTKRRRLV